MANKPVAKKTKKVWVDDPKDLIKVEKKKSEKKKKEGNKITGGVQYFGVPVKK